MVAVAVNGKPSCPWRTANRERAIEGTMRKRKTHTSRACSLRESRSVASVLSCLLNEANVMAKPFRRRMPMYRGTVSKRTADAAN